METGLGAVVFLTFCIIVVFGVGAFLVYRVMNNPGTHIGSRLPKDDADTEADPPQAADPDSDDGEDTRPSHP